MMCVLAFAFVTYDSQLALAQAADSLADFLTAGALVWAITISRRPADEDHPFGHQVAQPIAALVVAVFAGVLAAEVMREAITALVTGDVAVVTPTLLAAIGSKAVVKLGFVAVARRALRQRRSPALVAFYVDARNDVLVGTGSVVGLALAKPLGVPALDAWLAIPIALWVAWSGVTLGLENANLLMGSAPDPTRLQTLEVVATRTPGVRRVASLKARHHGEDIHLWLEIHVDPQLTIRQAHDIGEAVEHRLLEELDVCRADVHVDAAKSPPISARRAQSRDR